MHGFIPSVIDIEASGLSSEDYPIEIGVVRSDGERFCSLITPFKQWRHWNVQAESIHGISREMLFSYGSSGVEVCLKLNEFLRGETVYSDGWVVDYPWLIRLFEASAIEMEFRLSDIDYILNEQQMINWQSVKQSIIAERGAKRHRASFDAEIVQQTFVQSRSIEVQALNIKGGGHNPGRFQSVA